MWMLWLSESWVEQMGGWMDGLDWIGCMKMDEIGG
jgi:hypothetical protein